MNPTLITAKPQGRAGDTASLPQVPFVRAATQQTLPGGLDKSVALATSSRQVDVAEIPATGWLRGVWVLVEATGGVAGLATVAAKGDAPWSVIDSVTLTDPAGNQIFGPLSGYSIYLANFAGGYGFNVNPTNYGAYSAVTAAGNFSFLLYIPVEASERDGYGSLPNQDSSAAYRLTINQAASSAVYSTAPDTLPTAVRYRTWAEVWTQPTPTSVGGLPQAQQPPGAGTTQYWTREINPVVSGNNSLRVKRVGNLFRTMILVARDTSGDRMADTDLPDPIRLIWDNLTLTDEGRALRFGKQVNQYGVADSVLPAGVLIYSYSHDIDGKPGGELRNGLLGTTPATRFQIEGSFGAAGSLEVIINDIQPVGGLL